MEDTQLLKGILEGCVLAIIGNGETYGYLIKEKLKEYGFLDVLDGTLYPILNRLEKRGSISFNNISLPNGLPKKYVTITDNGKKELREFKKNYFRITAKTNNLLITEENYE